MALSPAQRQMRSRLAGLVNAATHDPLDYTLAARQRFLKSFLDRTPSEMPMEARLLMAERLRRAHYTRMALASSITRSKKAAAKKASTSVTLDVVEGHQPEAVALDGEEVTPDDDLTSH